MLLLIGLVCGTAYSDECKSGTACRSDYAALMKQFPPIVGVDSATQKWERKEHGACVSCKQDGKFDYGQHCDRYGSYFGNWLNGCNGCCPARTFKLPQLDPAPDGAGYPCAYCCEPRADVLPCPEKRPEGSCSWIFDIHTDNHNQGCLYSEGSNFYYCKCKLPVEGQDGYWECKNPNIYIPKAPHCSSWGCWTTEAFANQDGETNVPLLFFAGIGVLAVGVFACKMCTGKREEYEPIIKAPNNA